MRISDWSSDVCSSDLRALLGAVGQPGGVAEGGAAHAEFFRALGHQLGEVDLGAAERLGDDHRGVVGRLGGERQDGIFDGNAVAHVEAELGDRKSVVSGKSLSVRVDLGGGGIIKKKKK